MNKEAKTKYTVLGITFGPYLVLTVTMMILSACKEEAKKDEKAAEPSMSAEHFDYKGHQYILFNGKWRDEKSVVHDPDCKCGDETP